MNLQLGDEQQWLKQIQRSADFAIGTRVTINTTGNQTDLAAIFRHRIQSLTTAVRRIFLNRFVHADAV